MLSKGARYTEATAQLRIRETRSCSEHREVWPLHRNLTALYNMCSYDDHRPLIRALNSVQPTNGGTNKRTLARPRAHAV